MKVFILRLLLAANRRVQWNCNKVFSVFDVTCKARVRFTVWFTRIKYISSSYVCALPYNWNIRSVCLFLLFASSIFNLFVYSIIHYPSPFKIYSLLLFCQFCRSIITSQYLYLCVLWESAVSLRFCTLSITFSLFLHLYSVIFSNRLLTG